MFKNLLSAKPNQAKLTVELMKETPDENLVAKQITTILAKKFVQGALVGTAIGLTVVAVDYAIKNHKNQTEDE